MLFDTYRKLLDMFDPRERFRFYLLCGLMVCMGIIEAAGVASIMPFLAVVAQPSIIETQTVFREAYAWSGAEDVNGFLALLGLAVFAVFVLSIVTKSSMAYGLSRFSSMRGCSLSTRLMRRYLCETYAWYIGHNSADLARVVLNEIDQMVARTLMPALNLLRAAVVVVFLVGLVVAINPTVAIFAALVLGGSYLTIYRSVRTYLARLGEKKRAATALRYRLVQEAFGGIKEIKALGLEARYAERFVPPSFDAAEAEAATKVVGELPRHILEGIAFGGMLILVVTSLATHDEGLGTLLPTLGLYAFAGVRLFPAMQLIYYESASIRYSQSLLDSVHQALTAPSTRTAEQSERVEPLRLRERIELVEASYRYPGATRNALDHVTLSIPAQTTVGFVGGTGAGKTTAIDVIMGLLQPASGVLQVDGTQIDGTNARAWRQSLGYVPQQIYLADDTVAANIAFGVVPEEIDMAAVERAARIAELHCFITTELPEGYETLVGERGVRLSGGQRQRIGIARALYRDPDVVVLDEATSALDNLTEQAVMDAVHNLGRAKTVIIIAHRLSTVRHCDQIFLMDRGRLSARGSYDILAKKSDLFRRMAGIAAE